ncbi:hypothetical protein [Streptomyces sp. NBC_00122]|uniref:competence protein CoiA family protein n=1 Tax=Streptomyces sp. NBC_00122 TaxID=2903623 RepID=UPI003248D913
MGTVLELDKDDLGLPNGSLLSVPEVVTQLLLPAAERDRELLVCVESSKGRRCKAELSGVKSPYMYIRKHRGPDGALRLRAVHLPTVHEMTAEESDRHKAMKDFLARTAQAAGLEFRVEKTTKLRSSRPDVTIVGDGGLDLGCEAQYYNASAGRVLRRSKAHAAAGLSPNWITHDDTFHLVDRSNWMLTNQVTWREISNAADLALVGGYRVLAEWHCVAAAQRPCPDGKAKTGCGKVHLQWDTPRRMDDEASGWTSHDGDVASVTVGRTLIGAAIGHIAPLFVPSRKDSRAGSHLWVPLKDRNKWADYRSVDSPDLTEDMLDDEIHYSGREADTTCRFGEDTWKPSAPLKPRGIASVELSITIDKLIPAPRTESAPDPQVHDDAPAPAAPATPQAASSLHRGACETGNPTCGQPARFYAAGWRCDPHRPRSFWGSQALPHPQAVDPSQ